MTRPTNAALHRCDGRLNACWPHPKWHVVAAPDEGLWNVYRPAGLRPVAQRPTWDDAIAIILDQKA